MLRRNLRRRRSSEDCRDGRPLRMGWWYWNCSPPRAAPPARRPTRCWASLRGGRRSSRSPGTWTTGTTWAGAIGSPAGRRPTRQRAYARQLGSGVFTPALVVDGTNVVIGSQRAAVEAAIAAANRTAGRVDAQPRRRRVAVEVGAARVRCGRSASSTTRNMPPMSPPARMTASGCASTGLCARSRRWRIGTAARDGSPPSRPVPVRDRSSWCSRQTFVFSARRTWRPPDQGSPIVALTTSGSIFHSTMRNQDASRTAIHTTGANGAWLRRAAVRTLGIWVV